MGNYQHKENKKEKKKLVYQSYKANNETQKEQIYQKINLKKIEINSLGSKINTKLLIDQLKLYDDLFRFDNTKENDILEYLLLYWKLYKEKQIMSEEMKYKLDIYSCFISDENYNKYFDKFYARINSLDKIFNLIEKLKCDLDDSDEDKQFEKRKKFVNDIIEESNLEEKKKIQCTKQTNWENKELFIYMLYLMLLFSLDDEINYYKINKNKYIDDSKRYHKKYEEYILCEDDKVKKQKFEELQMIQVCESEFLKIHIKNIRYFLSKVDKNFKRRFQNNKFLLDEDRNIFEDYLYFLSCYKFHSMNAKDFTIKLWNETFVALSEEEKIELINRTNIYTKNENFYCELKNDSLIITTDTDQETITNIDNYCLSSLLSDLNNNGLCNSDYYKNKNLKPNFLKENLFVMKNKYIWKELNIKILNSNAIKEAVDTLFTGSYIDILSDVDYLSEVFDNIRFYTYPASSSLASSSTTSLRIHEYGLYEIKNNRNMSESLLFFYGFNTINIIHEISGNLNIQIQNFNLINNSCESPRFDKKSENYKLYSDYAKTRGKESGETIEIKLFGKLIKELTLKEALFILEPNNYKDLSSFTQNFKICNSKTFKEIISHETLELYLKPLGIKIEELPKNPNNVYETNKFDVSRSDQNPVDYRDMEIHPPEFYYKKDRKFIQ